MKIRAVLQVLFIALLALGASIALSEEDSTKDHDWYVAFYGGMNMPSVYVDMKSVHKMGRLIDVISQVKFPLTQKIVDFEDDETQEKIILPKPATRVINHMHIDCMSERAWSLKGDFYDENGLFYTWLPKGDPSGFTIEKDTDVEAVYKFLCNKELSEKHSS